MKAIPNSILLFRLIGMLVACWAVPALVCHYVGSAAGALAATGAVAFWFSQYRLPAWGERSGFSFWFVAGGYAVIGITLVVCLGRLMRVSL